MHIEFLVEEPSAEAALKNLVPKILGSGVEFRVIRFQGKQDLLSRLPGLLKGYRRWIPADWRIVVLVDEDRQHCLELKAELEKAAGDAGLVTKTRASGGAGFQVLNRISIEELEAWFFGDVEALHGAYPKIPLSLATRSKYHNPDAIQGGTWEELEKELRRKDAALAEAAALLVLRKKASAIWGTGEDACATGAASRAEAARPRA